MHHKNKEEENVNSREDFCPACVALPLAFSAGASAQMASKFGADLITMYVLAGIGVSSVIVFIYYMFFKKCDTCY